MALVLLGLLTAFLVVRGIVPALTRVDSDFPSYLTAARIVAEHGNTERLYDIPWFQEQMRRYGIGKPWEGKFQPWPPPTALLLVPIASLAPLAALRVMTAVSALCLIGSIVLLSRILTWSLIDTALLALLSGWAVVNAFRLGQPYILVGLSCIAGYYAYLRSRPWLAGMCFGLFTPVKYFPVVMLGYFAFRKRWRIVAGGALAILAVVLASIAILGWPLHEQFLSSVIGNHLVGQLRMQTPFTVSFQSFDSLFRRLFVFDATENPHPWVIAPMLHPAAVGVTKGAILLATIATLARLWRAPGATAPAIGLLGIVTLLLAPGTGTYHLVLLWLPVGLLVDYLLRQDSRGAYFLLGCYALIGYCPYGHSSRFAERGVLTVLAYPRLFLLLAMFLAGVYCLWNRRRQTTPYRLPMQRPSEAVPEMTHGNLPTQLRETQAAFDSVAADYDGPRGNNALIQDMRAEMWRWLDQTFAPGTRLLDLGCGTGLDAVRMAHCGHHVVATDWSTEMVARTAARARAEAVADRVEALTVGAHELERLEGREMFDGAYSNLGPLNCVPDLAAVSRACARLLGPSGMLVFTVIGRVCPWEVLHYLGRGRWSRIKVRYASNVVPVSLNRHTVWTRYYSPREFFQAFEREFALEQYRGLCVFAPPPYLASVRERHPRGYERLWRIDRRLAGWPVLRSMGDHFLIVMRKR